MNIELALETIKLTQEFLAEFPAEIKESITGTVKHYDVRKIKNDFSELKEPCTVEIVNDDTADAGYTLQTNGYNPAILNMASAKRPGNGWTNGYVGQEQCLFYRSTYHLALDQKYYPLDTFSAIYTPKIYFFRTKQLDGYAILPKEDCCFLSAIASSAVNRPDLVDGKYRPEDAEIMTEKIRGIFKVALKHKHDSIVLGAYGCGVFCNPPEEVAKIFKSVISEYKKYFRKIVFAILDYKGSCNLEIFKKIIN
jgi:uncharacterized protein (TIGR02452 family)